MHQKISFMFLFVLLSVHYASAAVTQDVNTSITIPLNKNLTFDNKEIYGEFIKINASSTIQVDFNDIGTNLSFIVFQVHSQYHNVTLYQNVPTRRTEVNGTNIGLVMLLRELPNDKLKTGVFYIQNLNPNIAVRAYISVHGYSSTDPYPGGCNMEFPVDITPYLIVTTKPAYITIDGAPPASDANCYQINTSLDVTFYMMYLPEQNFYADDYFSGIRRMMTLNNIMKYGTKLTKTFWPTRRMLSAYPGVGVIFVAVATSPGGYSVYVPNHSYGCEVTDEEGCVFSDDMVSELFCAAMLFVGLFVCFFGHKFFKTEMFLAGFFSGFIISYILITIMDATLDTSAVVSASALSGLFFGAIWLLFWWLYGLPMIAVLLPLFNFGFLIAAILYYRLPADVFYLKDDTNFWTIFIMTMCLAALVMSPVTYGANIMCCAMLGGFAVAYAFDYFMGSTLQYIIINTIRRAVVPVFNMVVLEPPFQWRDLVVALSWMLLTGLGWYFQLWDNQGRPPFPPPPRSTREAAPDSFTSYGTITAPSFQPVQTETPEISGPYTERTRLLREV